YTADPERLSLRATMPRFLDLEQSHGSVIRGLRAGAATRSAAEAQSAGARYSLFMSHRHGMGALVDTIAAHLPDGTVRLDPPGSGLERREARWVLRAGNGEELFDAIILAAPAAAAARLLGGVDAVLARELGGIAYASSATVTLAYRSGDVVLPPGFGFVVPA